MKFGLVGILSWAAAASAGAASVSVNEAADDLVREVHSAAPSSCIASLRILGMTKNATIDRDGAVEVTARAFLNGATVMQSAVFSIDGRGRSNVRSLPRRGVDRNSYFPCLRNELRSRTSVNEVLAILADNDRKVNGLFNLLYVPTQPHDKAVWSVRYERKSGPFGIFSYDETATIDDATGDVSFAKNESSSGGGGGGWGPGGGGFDPLPGRPDVTVNPGPINVGPIGVGH